jgi:hypothetical protein
MKGGHFSSITMISNLLPADNRGSLYTSQNPCLSTLSFSVSRRMPYSEVNEMSDSEAVVIPLIAAARQDEAAR